MAIFAPRLGMENKVLMFDVGHGDCVLIADSKDKGLLVDCGAWKPQNYPHVPRTLESLLPSNNKLGFVVSHYHWDHYNFFRWFRYPNNLFSKIYLPDLPITGPGRTAALAVMDFLKLAVFADFSYYRILPEIFTKTRRPVVFCKKGVLIHEAGLPLKVFWPDLYNASLGSGKVTRIADIVLRRIKPLMDHYDLPRPDNLSDYSMERFFRNLVETCHREVPEPERRRIHGILRGIERDFAQIADIFSIAFRTHYKRKSRFLFLGDLNDDLLDQIAIPGNKRYECFKAPHHGTTFGRALLGMTTAFLLVSRSQKDFPNIKRINDRYILEMQYQMLLSTEFLGDCYIS